MELNSYIGASVKQTQLKPYVQREVPFNAPSWRIFCSTADAEAGMITLLPGPVSTSTVGHPGARVK